MCEYMKNINAWTAHNTLPVTWLVNSKEEWHRILLRNAIYCAGRACAIGGATGNHGRTTGRTNQIPVTGQSSWRIAHHKWPFDHFVGGPSRILLRETDLMCRTRIAPSFSHVEGCYLASSYLYAERKHPFTQSDCVQTVTSQIQMRGIHRSKSVKGSKIRQRGY
jgi:hypothetical protein